MLVGWLLIGWGGFNLMEGLVDHEALGIHPVNETAPADQRVYWDPAFLVWGALMVALGRALIVLGARNRHVTDRAAVTRPQAAE